VTSLTNDPQIQLAFSLFENKGVFAVLIGSGLSRAAEIPTGWEITLDLIRRIGLAKGVEEQADWATWYRAQTGQEPNYSTLLENLAASPEERRSILHSYIEPTEEDRAAGRKVPTSAHRAIAALVRAGYIRVIVTTNFDRLMENALREVGIEPTIVASVDALRGAEPITHSDCYILKLHGDYKDARILNTDAELSTYPPEYDGLLDRILDEHGLIVCGWSGEWDHALRAAFLRAANRRYPVFWGLRGNAGAGAQELIQHRKARVVTIADADSLFTTLRQRIETLEQSQRQNPLGIELLVNSTKRFLAKPEHRIQVDELFTQEVERVLALLEHPDFAGARPWDQAEFRKRIRRYEAVSESLACMVGVLGRWGDGTELPLVIDIIRSLVAHANKEGNGLVGYLNLRSYPAVLIFTAYSLGLTRAERWKTLHELYSTPIDRGDHDPRRAVEMLFLHTWKGTEHDARKNIEGLERQKTPLSDHLLPLYQEWGKRFAGLTPDFELMFERFEVLGALAYLETEGKDLVRQAMQNEQPGRNFIWTPLGRVGWHRVNGTKLVAEMQSQPMKSKLLAAGFANGDEEFFDLCVQNIQRFAERMRWM
jgi:hypothetical protein